MIVADAARRPHRLKRDVVLPLEPTVHAVRTTCWKPGCRGHLDLVQASHYTSTSDVAVYACPECRTRWLWRTTVQPINSRGNP